MTDLFYVTKRVLGSVGRVSFRGVKENTANRTTVSFIAPVTIKPTCAPVARWELGITNGQAQSDVSLEGLKDKYKVLSPNNIIHQILSIESQMFTQEQQEAAYRLLNRIVTKVKENVSEVMSPREKLTAVYQAIVSEGLRLDVQADQLFISCLLGGNLDCDASSFVVLAVAQELNWLPVILVSTNAHVFVRWEGDDEKVNIDYGKIRTDIYYLDRFGVVRFPPLAHDGIIALIFNNRGLAKEMLGQHEAAIADFKEAISLDDSDIDFFMNLGWSYGKLGQHEAEIAAYDEVIKRNPFNSSAFNNRGVANKALGRLEEAIEDFKKAVYWGPMDERAKRNLKAAKADSGETNWLSKLYNLRKTVRF